MKMRKFRAAVVPGRTIGSALAALMLVCGVTDLASQEPAPGLQGPKSNSLGVSFVEIPGTTVLFATNETRVSDYQAFVSDAQYAWSFKLHFQQAPDHPVVGVSLQDAIAFCNWLTEKERRAGQINSSQSYRLPTNKEWSCAAGLVSAITDEPTLDQKIQDERLYPWGLQWPPPPKVANLMEQEIPGYTDGFPYTSPVGSFPATKQGLHDLSGNAWEWVWDRDLGTAPVGTLRGGSWAYFRPECLTYAYRYEVPAELRAPTIGFRMVFDDRNRTASMLAAASAAKEGERKQREQSMASSKVDQAELAKMRERILGTGGGRADVKQDISKLEPAQPGKRFTNSIGMTFVPVEGLPGLVGSTEVRAQEYGHWISTTNGSWEMKPSFLTEGAHPAVAVSWDDAKAFCEWLTKKDSQAGLIPAGALYRLPTDVEWSLLTGMPAEQGADPAARHLENKTHFPWGNDVWPPPPLSVNIQATKVAEGYRDNYSYTSPAGGLVPNSLGLFDLAGNAAEWCEDPWPGAADERVVRGGSWLSSEKESLLSGFRHHLAKSSRRSDTGFRCVLQMP